MDLGANMKIKSSLIICLFYISGACSAAEFCLQGESSSLQNPKAPLTPYFMTLGVSDLNRGHVQLTGSHCYEFQNIEVGGVVQECMPTVGSAIFYENKIELTLTSSEGHSDLGYPQLSTMISHASIDIEGYAGTIAFDINNKILTADGADYSRNHIGTVRVVACPTATKSEIREDSQFKRAISAMTRIKK